MGKKVAIWGIGVVAAAIIGFYISEYLGDKVPINVSLIELNCIDANDPGNDDELRFSSFGTKANGEEEKMNYEFGSKRCSSVNIPSSYIIWQDALGRLDTSDFIFLIWEEDIGSDPEEIVKIKIIAKSDIMKNVSFYAEGLPLHHDKVHQNGKEIGRTELANIDNGISFDATGVWNDGAQRYTGKISWNSQ